MGSLVRPLVLLLQNYKFRVALKYALRPHLFSEEPIDLREEQAAAAAAQNSAEVAANANSDVSSMNDNYQTIRFHSSSVMQSTTSL